VAVREKNLKGGMTRWFGDGGGNKKQQAVLMWWLGKKKREGKKSKKEGPGWAKPEKMGCKENI
jgi:hypothetical protein